MKSTKIQNFNPSTKLTRSHCGVVLLLDLVGHRHSGATVGVAGGAVVMVVVVVLLLAVVVVGVVTVRMMDVVVVMTVRLVVVMNVLQNRGPLAH